MNTLLFPGQGSQYVGMGKSFLSSHGRLFDEAEDTLGFPLKKLMFEGPLDALTETAIAQPAILLHSVICYEFIKEKHNLGINFGLGHSLGEYSALVAAGVLTLRDALKTVHTRGLLMQQAAPKGGGMAAVLGMDALSIVDALNEFSSVGDEYAAVANFNGPAQTVIAGTKVGVAKAAAKLKSLGAKRVIDLPVSAPFHSALMKPVAEKMVEVLSAIDFSDAKFPIISNVSAQKELSGETIKRLLIEQIYSPVRFTDCVQYIMDHASARNYLELGPKNVLCGLVKKIDENGVLQNIDTYEDGENLNF